MARRRLGAALLSLSAVLFSKPETGNCALFGGFSSDETADSSEDLERQHYRRLEERLSRRLRWESADPRGLDEAGHLPKLYHGGLRLKEVFIIHTEDPWTIRRAQVPEHYEAHDRSRRLHALFDIANESLKFDLIRDRVRTMAILSASAHVTSATAKSAVELLGKATEVYSKDDQVYADSVPAVLDDSWWAPKLEAYASENDVANVSNMANSTKLEALMLGFTAASIRENAGTKWTQDLFLGIRSPACEGYTTEQGKCLDDVGISVSVYDQPAETGAGFRVLVFHGGTGKTDFDYMMFLHRLWILERFEDQLMLTWNLDAGIGTTKNQTERRADTALERPLRCAFKDEKFHPAKDPMRLAETTDVADNRIEEQGFWPIVKQITRQILPEGRNQEEEPQTFFTGSGTGAMHAALASMWLKSVDDKTYQAYLMSGVGFECATRRLFQLDVRTQDSYEQLHSYSHVFDIFANSIDRKIGEDCLLGKRTFEQPGNVARFFCERIIGHTGPELFYRGEQLDISIDEIPETTPTEEMRKARLALEACSYFTHSPWYAAMLLMDDEVLHFDGKTDGGCKMRQPLALDDKLEKCPVKTAAEQECLLLLDNVQPLPVTAMIITASSLAGCICCIGLCGYSCLRRVRDDRHLYQDEGEHMPWPCCCLKRRMESDREALARQRVKDKRMKALQKEIKKQGIATDTYDMLQNKAAKKKKKEEGAKIGAGADEMKLDKI